MRGRQVAEALSKVGIRAEVRSGPSRIALRDVRDGVIICVKSVPLFGGWLRKGGNRIIFDAIDFAKMRGVPAYADAVITTSEFMRKRFQEELGAQVVIRTIYHHADPQLRPNAAGELKMKLVYVGERESSRFIGGEIPELHRVDFKNRNIDWREDIRNYNAHFSARNEVTKSVVKLANVAALQAVFLTGPEPGCVELLGIDYPFFLREPTHLPKVKEDVQRLKASVGSADWKEARGRIEEARSHLTIEATVAAYSELID